MTEDLREMRNALLIGLIVALLSLGCAAWARCEVIAFHMPLNEDGSNPCRYCVEMTPVEDMLVKEGYFIKRTDSTSAARMYGVRSFPTYVNVMYGADGQGYIVGRVVGKCTPGQLRRLCVMPVAATVGAGARNALRAVTGQSLILEW